MNDLLLFFLELLKLFFDLLVVEVSDILAKEELRPLVITPVLVLKDVMFLLGDIEFTGTSVLLLELLDSGSLLLDTVDDSLGQVRIAHNVVALLRLRNMQLGHDGLSLLGILGLQRQSVVNENVASSSLDIGDTIAGLVTHLDHVGVGLLGEALDLFARLSFELGVLAEIDLGEHNDEGLGLEQRLDRVEKADLLVDGVAASLRNVHEEQDASVEMRQGSDSLHFDRVSLINFAGQNQHGARYLPDFVDGTQVIEIHSEAWFKLPGQ